MRPSGAGNIQRLRATNGRPYGVPHVSGGRGRRLDDPSIPRIFTGGTSRGRPLRGECTTENVQKASPRRGTQTVDKPVIPSQCSHSDSLRAALRAVARLHSPAGLVAWESPKFFTQFSIVFPSIWEIATPACGLVRNDPYFFDTLRRLWRPCLSLWERWQKSAVRR